MAQRKEIDRYKCKICEENINPVTYACHTLLKFIYHLKIHKIQVNSR